MMNINAMCAKPSESYREYFRVKKFMLAQETEFSVSYYYF